MVKQPGLKWAKSNMSGINSCKLRKQTSTTKQANEQQQQKLKQKHSNYGKLLRGGYIQ